MISVSLWLDSFYYQIYEQPWKPLVRDYNLLARPCMPTLYSPWIFSTLPGVWRLKWSRAAYATQSLQRCGGLLGLQCPIGTAVKWWFTIPSITYALRPWVAIDGSIPGTPCNTVSICIHVNCSIIMPMSIPQAFPKKMGLTGLYSLWHILQTHEALFILILFNPYTHIFIKTASQF